VRSEESIGDRNVIDTPITFGRALTYILRRDNCLKPTQATLSAQKSTPKSSMKKNALCPGANQHSENVSRPNPIFFFPTWAANETVCLFCNFLGVMQRTGSVVTNALVTLLRSNLERLRGELKKLWRYGMLSFRTTEKVTWSTSGS
jgi:hypothetical protein